MSTFAIHINTDGDAFADGSAPYEINEILQYAAAKILGGEVSARLHDANGNRVGYFTYAAPDAPEAPLSVDC